MNGLSKINISEKLNQRKGDLSNYDKSIQDLSLRMMQFWCLDVLFKMRRISIKNKDC